MLVTIALNVATRCGMGERMRPNFAYAYGASAWGPCMAPASSATRDNERMTRIRFTKAHAAGHDFIVIEDAEDRLALGRPAIATLCDRHLGVGATGVLRLVRSIHVAAGREGLEVEPDAEWFVDAARADGTATAERVDGARIAARVLAERGLVRFAADGTVPIATRDGVAYLRLVGDELAVDLGRWRLAGGEPLVETAGLDVARPALGLDLGEPHLVVALSSGEELDLVELHRPPAIDPVPIDGASVAFVVPCDPFILDGTGQIEVRLHARDAGEVPASGAGVAAAALAVRYWAGQGAPLQWKVTTPGGICEVRIVQVADGEHVLTSGPVGIAFVGETELGT